MNNLNVGKFVLVLAVPLTIYFFIIFTRNSPPDHIFYFIVYLLASPLAAVITALLVALAVGIIYEITKIIRPFFEWLFK